MEGRKFPSLPVCLQDFLKVVFQISPGCVRLQLSDCQTFLRLPRRLPSCIHQKVSRQQFRKIWKSFQTMFHFFIYAVNMRNTCQLECIYMSPLTNALQGGVKALISDVRSSRYYASTECIFCSANKLSRNIYHLICDHCPLPSQSLFARSKASPAFCALHALDTRFLFWVDNSED